MKETTNLKLKLYDAADAPNLVAGYNASMEAIDKASAEWGSPELSTNAVYLGDGNCLQSPNGTNITFAGVKRTSLDQVIMDVATDNASAMAMMGGKTIAIVIGDEGAKLSTSEEDLYFANAGNAIVVKLSQLSQALAAIETMKTQIGELQTQIAAKADQTALTALTTRVKTAEGEIDTLQTGLAAATAAGTTQLTVADLTAAKTNTKNIVTA